MAQQQSDYNFKYFNVTFPREYVAQVEINRPEKLNAFLEEMWHNMGQIFNRISHDPNVRCVVLTSAGDRAFTAGLDVQAVSQRENIVPGAEGGEDAARSANLIRRHIFSFQSCITAIEKCESPVIAVLHGIAYGLALDISLACDIRICTSNTRFSVKEVDIGLAADIGTLTRLPKSGLPSSFTKDVALSAREFFPPEALRVGLVSDVFDTTKQEALGKALEKAALIASKSPVAVLGTKEVLNYSRDHSVEDGLNYVAVWNAAYLQTRDVNDALLAGLKKKKPTFAKL
ncbi:hypothetical protein AAFC00_000876 [Neodothiora populina]|uniref:Enoyl-CoA hydratase n=1 Tax=Neodothiora populina TaxID=2781224 RepID=A0ABR3PMB0_9PEZI